MRVVPVVKRPVAPQTGRVEAVGGSKALTGKDMYFHTIKPLVLILLSRRFFSVSCRCVCAANCKHREDLPNSVCVQLVLSVVLDARIY